MGRGYLIYFFLVYLVLAAMGLQFAANQAKPADPDWSEGAPIPDTGRPNPYRLDGPAYTNAIENGKIQAEGYPVEESGALPPFEPLKNVLDGPADHPFTRFIRDLFRGLTGIRGSDQVFEWLGLHPYPAPGDQGVYSVPFPGGNRPAYRLGLSFVDTPDGKAFTVGCAACHSANLFGKTVLGMTNRFPRANQFFIFSKLGMSLVSEEAFRAGTGASAGETRMYETMKDHLDYVGAKKPRVLGLDTSLAQVALSMARRAKDDYAALDPETRRHPRPEMLARFVADSKPAVWWDIKYKNRWLSDGSVVSGNPIYTNLLWNEIGRGADLHELEGWLDRNSEKVEELTSAVFSMEAPRFTDFFPPERIDLRRARHGERIFLQRCAKCHGKYDKAWDLPGADATPLVDQLRTVQVHYRPETPVIDVGTDPGRFLGMVSLADDLNPLEISRRGGIVIIPQKGYVPPPLVGIWARWPYFHNNSVPSLCAVLTRHEDRPKFYYAGEADDPQRDFDADCNGYPRGEAPPPEWKLDREAFYDASRDGMHNTGHDEKIFLENGEELLAPADKSDLIVFLQTL